MTAIVSVTSSIVRWHRIFLILFYFYYFFFILFSFSSISSSFNCMPNNLPRMDNCQYFSLRMSNRYRPQLLSIFKSVFVFVFFYLFPTTIAIYFGKNGCWTYLCCFLCSDVPNNLYADARKSHCAFRQTAIRVRIGGKLARANFCGQVERGEHLGWRTTGIQLCGK